MSTSLWRRVDRHIRRWRYPRLRYGTAVLMKDDHALDDKESLPTPLPPPNQSLSEVQPIDQRGVSLLFSLPAEIRLQIYGYVLAPPGVVHLFLRRRRVGHVRCTATDSSADQARSCMAGLVEDVIVQHKHYDLPSSSANTALLLTCRAVYQEAIDVLYAKNVFDVSHPQTFVCFARAIPQQRLASITSLHVTWARLLHPYLLENFSDSPQHWWDTLWETVADHMPGLKHVRLRLDGIDRYIGYDAEEVLLEPIVPLRGLQSFELDRARLSEEDQTRVSEIGNNIKDIVCASPGTSTFETA